MLRHDRLGDHAQRRAHSRGIWAHYRGHDGAGGEVRAVRASYLWHSRKVRIGRLKRATKSHYLGEPGRGAVGRLAKMLHAKAVAMGSDVRRVLLSLV